MPRFFIDYIPKEGQIALSADDAHHIAKVLRMKAGEGLTVCDGAGHDYDCVLAHSTAAEALCDVLGAAPSEGEPNVAVTLYMALPKGDKMDFIVQKAVELGAVRIVPFLAERSVSRPNPQALQKKCERWRKIAREAAMQCGRGAVPTVGDVLSQTQAAAEAGQCEIALFLYENEQNFGIRQALAAQSPATAALMVGPEGGFSLSEAQAAIGAGMQSVSLGKRILRCETAPLAALTAVMYESGNM